MRWGAPIRDVSLYDLGRLRKVVSAGQARSLPQLIHGGTHALHFVDDPSNRLTLSGES